MAAIYSYFLKPYLCALKKRAFKIKRTHPPSPQGEGWGEVIA